MSYLVAHMEKFKKEAVRGIQGHNQRERPSKSNPDIASDRSCLNYDLHNDGPVSYAKFIDRRIDSLNLKKSPRSDAVYMCEVVVSSDEGFFKNLSESEQRRFFLAAKEWLDDFAGSKNVIAAIVHLDEKTPHLHYSHVPVTKDGRLCAKDVYTKESLRELQNGLASYLKSRGFDIQRGVEQGPESSKKHLNTREFKQQKEAEKNLRAKVGEVGREVEDLTIKLEDQKTELQELEGLAQEAATALNEKPELPKPNFVVSRKTYEEALDIISIHNKALADKNILREENHRLRTERLEIDRLISEKVREAEAEAAVRYEALQNESENTKAELTRQNNILRQEVKAKDEVLDQTRSYIKHMGSENARLKVFEEKWLEHERLEKAKATIASEKAKADEPQQVIRKAPMLQQPPQSSQPKREERKNLSPGR